MPVCQFYLQGDCRYGDKCWNTHPNQGRQNAFGGGWNQNSSQRNVTFKDSFGTQNRFSTLAQQPKASGTSQPSGNIKDFTPTQIIDMVSQEMTVWEQSKMWPFSCYAYAKDTDCLPGFEDVSPEELRIEAYTAEKAGTFNNYKQKAIQLAQTYKEKRKQLHKPTPQLKQKLLEIIAENKTKSSGSSGGLFATTAASNNAAAFGKSGNVTSASLFGATTVQSTNAFGATQSTVQSGLFQSNVQQSNPFGNSQQPGNNLFQSANQQANQQQKPLTAAVGLFQQSPPAAAVGLFQQNPPSSAPALFQQNNNVPNNPSGGLFAQAPQPAKTGGLFQGQKIQISALNVVHQPQVPTVTNPFGDSITMNNPSQTTQESIAAAPAVPATQAATAPVAATVQNSGIYTPLDQLTKEEQEEFKKDSFTLGKIPIRPPPLELVT